MKYSKPLFGGYSYIHENNDRKSRLYSFCLRMTYQWVFWIVYFQLNDHIFFSKWSYTFIFRIVYFTLVTLDLLIVSDEAKIHIQGWKLHQHFVSLTDMKLSAKNPCCFLTDILFNNILKGLNQPTSPPYSTFFNNILFSTTYLANITTALSVWSHLKLHFGWGRVQLKLRMY